MVKPYLPVQQTFYFSIFMLLFFVICIFNVFVLFNLVFNIYRVGMDQADKKMWLKIGHWSVQIIYIAI